MEPEIIYKDSDIIVLDKPAGLVVHAANENDNRETLVSFLISQYPEIQNVGGKTLRPGIVHRLDKETSGLIVVAKNNGTFDELKKQFAERKIEKKYMALVSGRLEKDSGTIDMPLIKIGARVSVNVRAQGSNTKAKEAVTGYKVLERFEEYTLVEVMPKTGRMHQIRVHFTSINHPIACDKLYGRKSKKCPAGLYRHFLHASYLKFKVKNALMEFDSKLPEDLEKTIKSLQPEAGLPLAEK